MHLKTAKMVTEFLTCTQVCLYPVRISEKLLRSNTIIYRIPCSTSICFSSLFEASCSILPGTFILFSGPSSSLPQTRCSFGKMAKPVEWGGCLPGPGVWGSAGVAVFAWQLHCVACGSCSSIDTVSVLPIDKVGVDDEL